MAANAVKPDFFANLPSVQARKANEKTGVTDEEQALYRMALSDGWKTFRFTTEQLLTELEEINETAIANGMSYEELGKNTLVISLTRQLIRKLLNKVEDAKEACERAGN